MFVGVDGVCGFVCLIVCLLGFVFAFPVPTHVGDQTPVKQTRRKEVRRGRGGDHLYSRQVGIMGHGHTHYMLAQLHAYAQQHHDHDHDHHHYHHNLDNHHHVIGESHGQQLSLHTLLSRSLQSRE